MNANTETRATEPIVSLALLLAGSLLVGFSMGHWLAPLAAWIGPVLIMRIDLWYPAPEPRALQ